jgi:mannose-1-phosphate guanylyltransferase
MNPLYVVILAGGKGERFWPLSTSLSPKPFLRFFSDRSLLQQTYDRARTLVSSDKILLVAGKSHENLCYEQLPDLPRTQILLEPSGRDTSAAIGYASMKLPPEASILILPADHLIPDVDNFTRTINEATAFLQANPQVLMTFGIPPTRPETNYGYLQTKQENLGTKNLPVHTIARFVEKPDRRSAEMFVKKPEYYWNSGIFLWKVFRIQELIQQYLPDLWQGLNDLSAAGNDRHAAEIYARLPKISVDYGIMEKASNVMVVPAKFKWDDVGTWNALLRILPLNGEGNLVFGNHVGLDTSNCLIHAETQTIATAGVEDLIIVQSGDRLLVCTREYADRLKELLAKL